RILDLVDMDDPIPMGTGHPGIDQGHHGLSHLNGRKGDVHRDPQGTIAVPVGRGYLNEGHVQGQDAPSEKKMDLTEENGHIVPAMAVDETADVAPDKEGVQPETFIIGCLGVGCLPFSVYGYDLHFPEFPITLTERIDQ